MTRDLLDRLLAMRIARLKRDIAALGGVTEVLEPERLEKIEEGR